MNRHFQQFSVPSFATNSGLLLAVALMVSAPLLASTPNFAVPDDTTRRIRLDDTHGHVAKIDMSGKIKGHTSTVLCFDCLVMPGGRRAPIHAEILELYHAGIGSIIGGVGGLGTTAFHGHQKITLSSGQEMLIRITSK